MAKLPTLQIVTETGPVTINAEDFDPNVHELTVPAQAPVSAPAGNQPPNTPETAGNEDFTGGLAKLFVAKTGKRFKVVNENGTAADGFQKTGYTDEAKAWQAIKAATE